MAGARRHPLLLYARLFSMFRWPAFFIAVLCGVLWWFAPGVPLLSSDLAGWALLGVTGLCALLFVYTLIGPWLSYTRCGPKALLVSTPLFRLAVSYSRIRTVRPVKFVPPELSWSQRRFLEPFLGRTVIVVDLNAYPLKESWLRLWINRFMFPHDATGLLFLTPDWMSLSRDIETGRAEWKSSRIQRPASPVRSFRDIR